MRDPLHHPTLGLIDRRRCTRSDWRNAPRWVRNVATAPATTVQHPAALRAFLLSRAATFRRLRDRPRALEALGLI